MAENWIKIKESLYKGAFLRNEKRGSSSESSSNRDWAEGELFRQEPLSIEIRNGTLETGNLTEVGEDGRLEMGNGKRGKWTLDIGLEWFWMGNWPEHKHNECELTESNSAFYQLSVRLDNTLFTLRFFHQLILTTGSWDRQPVYLLTCGDHATSVSDEIDQEIKVCQNIKFFLRFFPSAHFDHWKLK